MQKLSDSELSIMMAIWEEDRPLYLKEIIESLKEFNWASSTIRNFLVRIIDKGYLKVEKDGRKNIYIPLVSKDYINKKGKAIIEKLYNNSVKKFIVELYESDSIDQDDLMELKNYLDQKINEEGN
ncbi:MAG TPA: BlaI/MecI/CopY family transcriptional regulator [Epulopiscium sp.]|nr:BlaI/MecI/CopY family transcriptional regulator [Candidatus Epulonipiscium sp.]